MGVSISAVTSYKIVEERREDDENGLTVENPESHIEVLSGELEQSTHLSDVVYSEHKHDCGYGRFLSFKVALADLLGFPGRMPRHSKKDFVFDDLVSGIIEYINQENFSFESPFASLIYSYDCDFFIDTPCCKFLKKDFETYLEKAKESFNEAELEQYLEIQAVVNEAANSGGFLQIW